MKLTRSIITTVFITLSAFMAVFITSCKDKCTNTTCFNGGSCSNGFCTCPFGYSGDHCEIPATSTIQYVNQTFTPITLTVNNHAYTIPAGYSKGFTGNYGDSLKGNAFTKGPYGQQVNWDTVFNIFQQTGNMVIYFNVSPTYFYLIVKNDSASAHLREFVVNAGLGTPYEQDIILPPPYLAYDSTIALGYFYASANSNVQIKTADEDGAWSYPMAPATTLGLPMTLNQYIQLFPN